MDTPQVLPDIEALPGSLATLEWGGDPAVSAVVVAVAPAPEEGEGVQPRTGTVEVAMRYGIDLAELADRTGGSAFAGTAGDVATVDLPMAHAGGDAFPWSDLPRRIILLGIGAGTIRDLRQAGAALAGASRGLDHVLCAVTDGAEQAEVSAFAEGYLLAAYQPPRIGSGADKVKPAAARLLLVGASEAGVEAAQRSARATWLVRDLTNTPSNIKNPAWFADQASTLGRAASLDVTVLGPKELAAQGFGAVLAVGAGSVSPPHVVVLRYVPPASSRHVVLVGKGITFDTGGISIKPRESMVTMKTDMAGAAVALATVIAAAEAGLPHRVTAVLPLAENHFGGESYRPADVLRTLGGRTVEIGDTDAEGRLVLADGLSYAVRDLEPDLLVDVATLTGAATLGLGRGMAAAFATDDELAQALEHAAAQTGEAVWRMPLVREYLPALRSEVADLRNVPIDSPGGGSITAALFLAEFTGGLPWVHLDIAGPARATTSRHEVTEGATGYGARLLVAFLAALS